MTKKVSVKNVLGWMKDSRSYEPMESGSGTKNATQRNTVALCDVDYIIEAEPWVFEKTERNYPKKYFDMFQRRVEKGQCRHRPSLGCREFVCDFMAPDGSEVPIQEDRDLGWMLYDIAFGQENEAIFFQSKMVNGVVNTLPHEVLRPEWFGKVMKCSFKNS